MMMKRECCCNVLNLLRADIETEILQPWVERWGVFEHSAPLQRWVSDAADDDDAVWYC
jgi:hypothetical protein